MKKTTLRHIIISLFKTSDKGKILKAAREKKTCITHRNEDKDNLRFPVGNNTSEKAAELHLEVLLKEENCQSTIPHPGKIPLKSEVKESFFFFFF